MESIQIVQKNAGKENICLQKVNLTPVRDKEVIVEMIAAPINPADLGILAGSYPVHTPFPRIIGHEGVGIVVDIGEKVREFKAGDRVILIKGMGSFATHLKKDEEDFLKIPDWIPWEMACFLRTSIMTAFRLIQDFIPESKLKCLIQNGSNSAVGLSVIAIAKAKGIFTINVLRNPLHKEALEMRGADAVIMENALSDMELKKYPKAKLALDCIGGFYGLELSKQLEKSGSLVVYGSMSKKPLEIAASELIFKNIVLKGFWLTHWLKSTPHIELVKSFNELYAALKEEPILIPIEKSFSIDSFLEALKEARKPFRSGKIIFNMQPQFLR